MGSVDRYTETLYLRKHQQLAVFAELTILANEHDMNMGNTWCEQNIRQTIERMCEYNVWKRITTNALAQPVFVSPINFISLHRFGHLNDLHVYVLRLLVGGFGVEKNKPCWSLLDALALTYAFLGTVNQLHLDKALDPQNFQMTHDLQPVHSDALCVSSLSEPQHIGAARCYLMGIPFKHRNVPKSAFAQKYTLSDIQNHLRVLQQRIKQEWHQMAWPRANAIVTEMTCTVGPHLYQRTNGLSNDSLNTQIELCSSRIPSPVADVMFSSAGIAKVLKQRVRRFVTLDNLNEWADDHVEMLQHTVKYKSAPNIHNTDTDEDD